MGIVWGALFGYLLMGWFGALLGGFIGYQFQKGLHVQFAHWGGQLRQAPQHFLRATFLVMGYVAKADGQVSKNEIGFAEQWMKQMNFNHKMRKQAIAWYGEGKRGEFDLLEELQILKRSVHGHRGLLQFFTDLQYQAASVDGFSTEKKIIFQKICEILSTQIFEGSSYQVDQSGAYEDPYAMLGVSRSANMTEVKRAYRRAMSASHPDKLIAKGLPKEMIDAATEKAKKIQKAYEQIKKERRG